MPVVIPQMYEVDSSLIGAIGYDRENMVLFVQFKKGGMFAYYKVPDQVFREMLLAESIGRFFLKEIKLIYKDVQKVSG